MTDLTKPRPAASLPQTGLGRVYRSVVGDMGWAGFILWLVVLLTAAIFFRAATAMAAACPEQNGQRTAQLDAAGLRRSRRLCTRLGKPEYVRRWRD